MLQGDSPIVIRTFSDAIAAHIAQAALDAHGIPAYLLGDDAGGMQAALTFSHGVRLCVRHRDAIAALRVLDGPAPEQDEVRGTG